MTEQRIEELQADSAEMIAILRKHGLLMELSEATLTRNLSEDSSRVAAFKADVDYLTTLEFSEHCHHFIDRAQSIVEYVRRVSTISGERINAMQLLVDAGNNFSIDFCEYDEHFRNEDDAGYDELYEMDGLMCDLVRRQFQACKVLRQDWDPGAFIKTIEDTREWRIAGADDDYFERSLYLLRVVSYCRVAAMLAWKTTGYLLPPELVEMVADHIYGDEELRAAG